MYSCLFCSAPYSEAGSSSLRSPVIECVDCCSSVILCILGYALDYCVDYCLCTAEIIDRVFIL